jgi:hypothetical protein
MEDNNNATATLVIPRALAGSTAHWLPIMLRLKLDSLSDAELGPFAPGSQLMETEAAPSPAPAADDAPSSDQQQQQQNQSASAPASAALKASLRGRALAGARWPLPEGVGGLVLEPAPDLDVEDEVEMEEEDHYDDDDDYGMGKRQKQQQRPGSAGGSGNSAAAPRQRSWRAVAAFSELVAWNHDTTPAPTDAAWRLMDFLAVSAAAHGVVGGVPGAPPAISAADVDAEVGRARVGGRG